MRRRPRSSLGRCRASRASDPSPSRGTLSARERGRPSRRCCGWSGSYHRSTELSSLSFQFPTDPFFLFSFRSTPRVRPPVRPRLPSLAVRVRAPTRPRPRRHVDTLDASMGSIKKVRERSRVESLALSSCVSEYRIRPFCYWTALTLDYGFTNSLAPYISLSCIDTRPQHAGHTPTQD